MDVWSCGCILAEMLGRSPLFPGKTFIHQLSLVFDVIGSPPEHDVLHIVNAEARSFLQSQHGKRKTAFSNLYPKAETNAWKLLDQFLQFNPDKRITVDDALQSPYLHGVGSAISLAFPDTSPDFVFSFETADLTRSQLRQLICEEITSFRREKSPRVGRAANSQQGKKSASQKGTLGTTDAEVFDTDDGSTQAAAKDDDASSSHKNSQRTQQEQRSNGRENLGQSGRKKASSSSVHELSPAPPPPQPVDETCAAPAPVAEKGYLRGTKNFRTRVVSAPRARPRARREEEDKHACGGDRKQEEKEEEDDNSVQLHSRNGKPMRLEQAIRTGERSGIADTATVSAAQMTGDLPAASKQSSNVHATDPENVSEFKREEGAVRQSTIRNMLNMCDELYYGTQAPIAAAGKNNNSMHSNVADFKNSDNSLAPAPAHAASLRDSKEVWSSALYHTTQSDGAGMSSPSRGMRASSSTAAGTMAGEASRLGGGQREQQHTELNAKSSPPRRHNGTLSSCENKEDRSLIDDLYHISHAAQTTAEPKRYTSSTFERASTAVGRRTSDSNSDSDEEPVPRSPPRKSLLATYTSPKRLAGLGGGNSSDRHDGSPGASPARPFPPRDRLGMPRPVPTSPNGASDIIPTGNSLVDKLLERAQRLNFANEVPVPHNAHANSCHATAAARAYAAGGGGSCGGGHEEEDSSVGSSAQVYPESGPTYTGMVATTATTHVSAARDNSSTRHTARDGIAGLERPPGGSVERNAPPIIPPPPDKKKFTVAKSPKFSQMSWQRRQREAQERMLREQEEEEQKRRTKTVGKASNYFGYQAPKRSDSAPRPHR